MKMTSWFQHDSLRQQRLRFIQTHRDAFDVEPSFPLPLFEKAILDIEGACGVEMECNVEGSRLLAGEFNVVQYGCHWPKSLTNVLKFLEQVESRVDVKINRNLLELFSQIYISSSKIERSTIGIDLHPTLKNSLIKVYLDLDPQENPEDLVRTAILLDCAKYSAELTEVLVRDCIAIGFNFFLDGRSNIEILAGSPGGKYESQGKWGKYLTAYIRQKMSPKFIFLFEVSDLFVASFSKQEPVFYFNFFNIKDIPKYFAFNSLGDRIYDFCQSQDCLSYAGVAVKEQDLESSRLENYSFRYLRNDICQLDQERLLFIQSLQ